MKRAQICSSIALVMSILGPVACAGSAPQAATPAEPVASAAPVAAAPSAAPSADEQATETAPTTAAPKEQVPEPVFTPDMSVEDAIKAIPQSAERLNVDQETLSKPLQEESLYAPCKPGAAHFTMRIAVWRGKAVAIDLTTTPKNPKLAECLKTRIRELTWPAKVPSLNTVEYSM